MGEVRGGQDVDLRLGSRSLVVDRLGIVDLGRGIVDSWGRGGVVDHRRGAWPGMLVMMSHCRPLLAAADPEEVPEGSGEVIDKVCQ